jgi:glutamate dehydrogenase (NAD(P)+)
MKGVLVIDNTSTGPGKGGIRFADANPNEVDRVSWIKSFAKMIKPYCPTQYIAATDIGTPSLSLGL